jgi:hypothetical protein
MQAVDKHSRCTHPKSAVFRYCFIQFISKLPNFNHHAHSKLQNRLYLVPNCAVRACAQHVTYRSPQPADVCAVAACHLTLVMEVGRCSLTSIENNGRCSSFHACVDTTLTASASRPLMWVTAMKYRHRPHVRHYPTFTSRQPSNFEILEVPDTASFIHIPGLWRGN